MTTKTEQLDELISNATRELTPQRDLWAQIERRLDAPLPQRRNYWRPLAIASLIVLSVVGGNQLMQQSEQVSSPQLLLTLAAIKEQHQQQVAQLQSQTILVGWKNSPYGDPVEQGIAQLREAAELIYNNLRLNPTDKQLWQLWLWTQQREIELVKQGQKLPTTQTNKGDAI